jgi:hypothetical protein
MLERVTLFMRNARKRNKKKVLLYECVRDELSSNFVCSLCRRAFLTDDPADALRMFVAHPCKGKCVLAECASFASEALAVLSRAVSAGLKACQQVQRRTGEGPLRANNLERWASQSEGFPTE